MLYLFIYIVILICSFNPLFIIIFDFNIFYILLIFYSYLVFNANFLTANAHTSIYNINFFSKYLYIMLKFFFLKLVYYINTLNIHTSFFSFILKWKPLFKKSSYFGIYRSTKNQFLNK